MADPVRDALVALLSQVRDLPYVKGEVAEADRALAAPAASGGAEETWAFGVRCIKDGCRESAHVSRDSADECVGVDTDRYEVVPLYPHPPALGAEGRALALLVRARPVMFLECPDPQQMERLIAVKDEIDALLRAEGGTK